MLTKEENELLCRVEGDAPMGQLMRRHWLPACLTEEVALPDGDPVPDHDYFAFLLSLPRAFRTTVATIPPPLPGLTPVRERSEVWAGTLSALRHPRVGVVWAGRPEHLRDKQRSMPLEALAPVLKLPGIAFVGLQKGPAVAQCETIPESVDWTGLGPALDTLDDAIFVTLDGFAFRLGKPRRVSFQRFHPRVLQITAGIIFVRRTMFIPQNRKPAGRHSPRLGASAMRNAGIPIVRDDVRLRWRGRKG